MRPKYENKESLTDESKVATAISKCWGVECRKLPISYHVDFLLVAKDGEPKAFAEVKRRHMVWGDYPDIMLSCLKVRMAKSLEESLGLKTMFVVLVDDGIYFVDLSNVSGRRELIRHGGRTKDRRDFADVEPVVHIPCREFSRIDNG